MFCGVIEYCGVQRCGKNTLLAIDLYSKVLRQNPARRLISNIQFFGLPPETRYEYFDSEALVDEILRLKESRDRDVVIAFDEAGQFIGARSFGSRDQTKCVNFAWQCPKRGHLWLYTDNLGNSTDIQLGLATTHLLMPHYHGGSLDREPLPWKDQWMDVTVVDVRAQQSARKEYHGFSKYQTLYDTKEPVI
jgi:hypothetical protein